MDKTVPCNGCEKRHLGCHAVCEDYKEWRSKRDLDLVRKYKARQISTITDEVRFKGKKDKRRSI